MYAKHARRTVLVCVLAVGLVAGAAGAANAAAATTCYAMSGYVRDRAGRPLDGATVSTGATVCNGPRSVVTGADGRYELHVVGGNVNGAADISVVKTGYGGTTQHVTATPKVGAIPTQEWMNLQSTNSATPPSPPTLVSFYDTGQLDYQNNDFTLSLTPNVSLSSTAVRPPASVGVTIRVAAPPPGPTGTTVRVLADRLSSGAALTLTPSYGTDGWTTWTGTLAVAAGEPDRSDAVRVCAVTPDYTGSCSAAPATKLLANVVDSGFKVDSTPPVLTSANPAPYRNVTNPSQLTLSWADALAGLPGTAGSLAVWVDGTSMYTTLSGASWSYTPIYWLAPGVHTVQARATDRAGNVAWRSWIFTIVAIGATDANATVREATVRVNPNNTLPPPGTVTFAHPTVDLGAFDETYTASTFVGQGTVRRPYTLGAVDVVFTNETGLPKVVTATIPQAYATHDVAVLTSTTHALSTHIAAGSMTVGDVTVSVPAGYTTPGSTATLRLKTTALGSPTAVSSELNPTAVNGPVTVLGSLEGCFAGDQSSQEAYCQTGERATAQLPNGTPVANVIYPATDVDWEANLAPSCTGCSSSQAVQYVATRTVYGCVERGASMTFVDPDTLQPTNGVRVDLCDAAIRGGETVPSDGMAGAFLNTWLFSAPQGLYPVWHQSHVDAPATGDRCPAGQTGTAYGRVYRVAANVLGLDGAEDPEEAGVVEPTDEPGMPPTPQTIVLGDGSRGYSVTHDSSTQVTPLPNGTGQYWNATSAWVDSLGTAHGEIGATSNMWEYDPSVTPPSPASGVADHVTLVTGTTFRTGSATYARGVSLDYVVTLDLSGCRAVGL